MNWITDTWNWLSGKKTHVCDILIALLTAVFLTDALFHDDPKTIVVEVGWFTLAQYAAAGAFLGAGSQSALRASVAKGK